MNRVQPIRSLENLEDFKNELRKRDYKYYVMAILGLNTGLRISDVLSLKVKDIKDKTHLEIREKKTNKTKRFLINKNLKRELKDYVSKENLDDEDYLIYSNKKERNGESKSISRVQAYSILHDTAEKLNIKNIGTHSLRKSFGYFHYQKYKDVAVLQEIFNHSSPSITLKYIGINDDIIDKTIQSFYL